MNISLIDVDSHNFPNLALMKISQYHKNKGDNIKFHDPLFDKPDLCYASKIFTYTSDYQYFPDCEIRKGGTGYNIKSKLPEKIDRLIPDYSLYNCEHAYGFLTRGCIRKCEWCIVPEKEGNIYAYMDIDEIIGDKKSVILMDNNVLASEHGIKQIKKISKMDIKIDFNQGLDARLIDNQVAKLLSRIKWIRFIRFSCDTKSQMNYIKKAISLIRKFSNKKHSFFCYLLVTKDIEDAVCRATFLKNLDVSPFAQAYRDHSNSIKVTKQQKNFCRWVNIKSIFKSVEWENYTNIRK